MLNLLSHNEPETLAIGRVIGSLLRTGDVVAIDGPLGAGKTRLVRGIAMGMGSDASTVSSPTYVVVNEYEAGGEGRGVEGGPGRLFHVDAYRLTSAEDLDSLGWDRVMDPASDAAVAIEWAERIAGFASQEQAVCRVRMEPVGEPGEAGEGQRVVSLDPPKAWRDGSSAWRDLERLAQILRAPDPASGNLPRPRAPLALPRGWGRCPTTGKPVPPDAPTFPFADERARLADLGRWMSGAYSVSREIRPEDEEG